jgi:bifunctional ADP-heptose synthase (sugar kinase/adenylyltransferase)
MYLSTIYVLGDPIADIYLHGSMAPVHNGKPRLTCTDSRIKDGGAANVTANIDSLLQSHALIYPLYPSTAENWHQLIRYIADDQLVLEVTPISHGNPKPYKFYSPYSFFRFELNEDIVVSHNDISTLIISDYNKGMANKGFYLAFFEALQKANLDYLIVDSRYGTVDPLLLSLGKTKILHCTDNEIDLHDLTRYDYTFHTSGPGPVYAYLADQLYQQYRVPAETPVVDTTGAGDTFVASIAAWIAIKNKKTITIEDIDSITEYAIGNCQQVIQTHGTAVAES